MPWDEEGGGEGKGSQILESKWMAAGSSCAKSHGFEEKFGNNIMLIAYRMFHSSPLAFHAHSSEAARAIQDGIRRACRRCTSLLNWQGLSLAPVLDNPFLILFVRVFVVQLVYGLMVLCVNHAREEGYLFWGVRRERGWMMLGLDRWGLLAFS